MRRATHRRVGWCAVVTGALAALSAASLSWHAFAGTWIVFLPWTCLWLLSAVMTGITATQKRWIAHRWWAKVLTQNGLAFVSGRVSITALLFLGVSHSRTYYYSVAVAFFVGWARSTVDMIGLHRVQRKQVARTRFKVAVRAVQASSLRSREAVCD